jgi:translocator protein
MTEADRPPASTALAASAAPAATAGFSRAQAAAIASAAFLVPLALSASTSPSPNHPRTMAWYLLLRKPWFKPPDWVIPVAWTGIESSLAWGAFRLLRAAPGPARRRALGLLGWNVGMIGGWSRMFFGRKSLADSTLAAATMLASGAAYVQQARRVDPVAARTGVPFVAWVGFATVLTAALWHLNGDRRR